MCVEVGASAGPRLTWVVRPVEPGSRGLGSLTRTDHEMRALQFTEYGGPEVLRWGDAPEPRVGSGEIRIAVRAASVNPVDWKIFTGALSGGQRLTATGYLGSDAAGVVDEVGAGVTGVSAGDEAFGVGAGTQAEYAVLKASALKAPSLAWAVAAAAGVAGDTSERGLRLLGVKAGETIFIDGGAGGVGAVAAQMADARGARVIASASEANQDYLREIGAVPVRYGEGVAGRVRAAAGGRVDAVLDVAGKTPVQELVSLVSEPSQVLSIANFAAIHAGARVTGAKADSRPMEALAEVAELLAQNKLVIKVQTFPFDRAADAYRISRSGHVRGKLVLVR
jgi:NADPH:quinone reductase-like Zn-dependent oxidoreductase